MSRERIVRRRLRAVVWVAVIGLAAPLAAGAATVTFREGEGGYAGTRDTYVEQNLPAAPHGADATIRWDADYPASTGLAAHALLRFENVVGPLPGQVPPGAFVNSAVLTYTVTNLGDVGELREALADWDESSTLASLCGTSCGPSVVGPLVATMPAPAPDIRTTIVTASVQAWAGGAPNRGWIVVPTGPDGVELASREHSSATFRPLLTVTFDEAPSVTVIRQPYLQLGTPTSMTIVWRTVEATDSRVRFGAAVGAPTGSVTLAAATTHHVVTLTGLLPATRYYYDVGSTTQRHAGGTAEHYFETSPPPDSGAPLRAWVVGDSGTGGAAQAQVRDAMLAATAAHRPDLFLHLGDIAYNTGTEGELTANHFTPYRDILRNTPLWPTLGNHEGQSTVSGAPGGSIGPYYDAFVLPTAGEAGGEPSGTEAYYSFDHGDVHFVSLNSYQVDRSATGAMATWLAADLAATDRRWIVAYWHHPPYTQGTHDSDVEIEHVEMRENLLPILEAGGGDLVLGGHSHGYERSVFLDGSYATPTPPRATLAAQGHVLDAGDGNPTGNGAYWKSPGLNPREGAAYVVAGHGGAPTGGALDHPAMRVAEAVHGSAILDVAGDTLTLTNLRATGVMSDLFSIVKRPPAAPVVEATDPPRGAAVTSLPAIEVAFSAPVTGVDAADLIVGGAPAASVEVVAADRYRFGLASPPATGTVGVTISPGGIVHASAPALAFAGDSFTLTLLCGADGTPCNDGNPCSVDDTCSFGTCAGAVPVPADVTNLVWWADKTTLAWDDTAGAGSGGRYDLARGALSDLPLDGDAATCLESSLAATEATDPSVPEPGAGTWYLVRGNTACFPGTWGREGSQGTPGTERAIGACP